MPFECNFLGNKLLSILQVVSGIFLMQDGVRFTDCLTTGRILSFSPKHGEFNPSLL